MFKCCFNVKFNPSQFIFSTYLSRIMTVSPEQEKYREWVKTCYKPTIFIPKTIMYANPINSPVYQVAGGVANHQFINTSNGRPPLLPTPPSPYSPRVNLITSPYATYPSTTTFGFFEATPTGSAGIRPTLIIPTVSGATAANMRDGSSPDIVSTQISTLQLNPSSPAGEMVISAQPHVQYVIPTNNTYIQQQHQQQQHNVVTQQSFSPSSPTKSVPTSLSNILQRLNSHTSNQNKKSNSSSNYYNNNNNKWNSSSSNNSQNNSARNSQRNSPKSSPKLNSRAFSYPTQPIMQLQHQPYIIPTAPIHQDSLAAVPATTVTTTNSDRRQESRIYYTAEQLRNLNPKANIKEGSRRNSERVPVEEFDPSALITGNIVAIPATTTATRQQQQKMVRNSNTSQQQNGSTKVNSNNKDVIVISDGE